MLSPRPIGAVLMALLSVGSCRAPDLVIALEKTSVKIDRVALRHKLREQGPVLRVVDLDSLASGEAGVLDAIIRSARIESSLEGFRYREQGWLPWFLLGTLGAYLWLDCTFEGSVTFTYKVEYPTSGRIVSPPPIEVTTVCIPIRAVLSPGEWLATLFCPPFASWASEDEYEPQIRSAVYESIAEQLVLRISDKDGAR